MEEDDRRDSVLVVVPKRILGMIKRGRRCNHQRVREGSSAAASRAALRASSCPLVIVLEASSRAACSARFTPTPSERQDRRARIEACPPSVGMGNTTREKAPQGSPVT
jgi:hypothetical protein